MSKKKTVIKQEDTHLIVLWAVLYTLCAALGFISQPEGALAGFMVVLALAFFLPPALLLYRGVCRGNWAAVRRIRNLSIASLGLSFLLLMLSFLSIVLPTWVGDVLHILLALASVPMLCSQAWALSLFLWACLLMVTLKYRKMK